MNILITGSSRGIGSEICKLFISRGHNVYSPNRKELDLNANFILPHNNFDIIVNNAGVNPLNSIVDMDQETVMRINYCSPLKIIQQCLPSMINNRYGRIINMGSIWSHISKENRAAYSASKAALESLARSITAEYGKYNILANTVSPGFIGTDLTYQNNTKEDLDKIINNIPVGRLGNVKEIADLVYYLTIQNNFIAGQNIIIDGGYTCTA